MSSNTDLIEDFCRAWGRLDPAEIASYFTEDGVYHNMPTGPVRSQRDQEVRSRFCRWLDEDRLGDPEPGREWRRRDR